MNNNLKNKNEQGRSMVEMLGVLAIIGVLSVAGIAGYTVAMRSHRSNEIVNAASLLYMMSIAKNQGNGANTTYTTEVGTPPSGADGLAYDANTKSITITFQDEKDCAMVKEKLGDKAGTCTVAEAPNTGYTLAVNFGETTTSGAVADPSSITDEDECINNGYYWINNLIDTTICVETPERANAFCIEDGLEGVELHGHTGICLHY